MSAEKINSYALKNAKALYKIQMQGFISEQKPFLSEKNLFCEHEKNKGFAIECFQKQPNIGNCQISQEHLSRLREVKIITILYDLL